LAPPVDVTTILPSSKLLAYASFNAKLMYIEPPLRVAAVPSVLFAWVNEAAALLIAQKLLPALYEPPAEAATTVTVICPNNVPAGVPKEGTAPLP